MKFVQNKARTTIQIVQPLAKNKSQSDKGNMKLIQNLAAREPILFQIQNNDFSMLHSVMRMNQII